MLAPQVPWPMRQGTAIRNCHIARLLAQRHDVTLASFADPFTNAEQLTSAGIRVVSVAPPPPRTIPRRLAELALVRTPDLSRRLLTESMRSLLAELAREETQGGGYDVLQVEGLEMALYGLEYGESLTAGGKPGRLIYDAHNAEWVLQHRAWQADIRRLRGLPGAGYSIVQTLKLRAFERRLLRRIDATVAVSDADATALRSLAPGAAITVVPNGVDLATHPPADRSREDPTLCVFVGKMDFRPNIDAMSWFCGQVWPGVRAAVPGARLAIVGSAPVPRVLALAGLDVVVTGEVEDVVPWLERAAVVVVPLRVGGGTRLKVLEAMAMEKAIVATSMAVEGLDLIPGVEAVVADGPGEQAEAIARLTRDAAARAALGKAARHRVRCDYRWEDLIPRIESLYR